MSEFNKTCWKVAHTNLVCVVKFLDQSKTYWVCESLLKFTGSIWIHHTTFWWLQLWGLVAFSSNVHFQSNLLGFVPLKHFSRRRFNHRCDFLLLFSLLFWHFKTILQTQWVNWMIFFFTNVLICLFRITLHLNFFHLSRFRVWISPPNLFLRKFQHLFSTLKHYNLSIYVVKWSQI